MQPCAELAKLRSLGVRVLGGKRNNNKEIRIRMLGSDMKTNEAGDRVMGFLFRPQEPRVPFIRDAL